MKKKRRKPPSGDYWNNRVVRYEYPRKVGKPEVLFEIHEAHYTGGKRRPYAITREGATVIGETKAQLRETLKRMLRCLDAPTLRYEDFVPQHEDDNFAARKRKARR